MTANEILAQHHIYDSKKYGLTTCENRSSVGKGTVNFGTKQDLIMIDIFEVGTVKHCMTNFYLFTGKVIELLTQTGENDRN